MPSISFYYTIKLWTRTEACDMDFLGKHHCVYKPSNRVNPVIGLCIGTATESENSSMEMTPVGQTAQLPANSGLFATVCLWMLYPLKFQMLYLMGLVMFPFEKRLLDGISWLLGSYLILCPNFVFPQFLPITFSCTNAHVINEKIPLHSLCSSFMYFQTVVVLSLSPRLINQSPVLP